MSGAMRFGVLGILRNNWPAIPRRTISFGRVLAAPSSVARVGKG